MQWVEPLLQLPLEELNLLPHGHVQEAWPQNLKQFVRRSVSLSLCRSLQHAVSSQALTVHPHIARGMSQKKLHEVSHMAGLVQEVCRRNCVEVVLDIGAGLGYLGDVLAQQCGLVVVGLEREVDRVKAARTRNLARVKPATRSQAQALKNTLSADGEESCHINTDERKMDSCHSGGRQEEEKLEEEDECEEGLTLGAVMTGEREVEEEEVPGVKEWAGLAMEESLSEPSLDLPCKISLGLDVLDTPTTRRKIVYLIEVLLSKLSGVREVGVCVVGLHCCGSLANTILKIFSERLHPAVKCLVLLGCCYHKTGHAHWTPMSQELRDISQARFCQHPDSSECGLLSTYGLRLAAQETKDRWKDQSVSAHARHKSHVANRGMLQAVLHSNSVGDTIVEEKMFETAKSKIAEKTRTVGKDTGDNFDKEQESLVVEKEMGEGVASGGEGRSARVRGLKGSSLEEYAAAAADTLQDPGLSQALLAYYSIHRRHINYIQPFTALQVCMQGVLETLLLRDQEQFLLETGVKDVQLVPVFSPHISPRNVAVQASFKIN